MVVVAHVAVSVGQWWWMNEGSVKRLARRKDDHNGVKRMMMLILLIVMVVEWTMRNVLCLAEASVAVVSRKRTEAPLRRPP